MNIKFRSEGTAGKVHCDNLLRAAWSQPDKEKKENTTDKESCDLLNHELRVASNDIKITSYELESTSYDVKSTSCELEFTSYNIKSTSYNN